MSRFLAFVFLCCNVFYPVYAEEKGALWEGNAAFSFSRSIGNTQGVTYSLAIDETRTTETNKLSVLVSMLYGKSGGIVNADKGRISTRYDKNFNPKLFSFGLLELEQDRMANLDMRTSLGGGLGYHVLNREDVMFNLFCGLSRNRVNFTTGSTVNTSEVILAEESAHALTSNTRLKQKLSYYPNIQGGGYRSVFDSSLVVSINDAIGLSISLQNKYNSDSGTGIKHSDTLLLTGLNVKL